MEALLIKNDAWSYVCGERVKPEVIPGDATSEAAKRWEIEDQKAKSDIILSINPSELKQIKGCNTSLGCMAETSHDISNQGPCEKNHVVKTVNRI